MTIGIYKLTFIGTDKVYIGQSKNIEFRYNRHIAKLKEGIHTKKLTQAYNVHGLPILSIEHQCNLDMLDSLETETIQQYNSVDTGFNTNYYSGPGGSSLCGEDNPNSRYANTQIIQTFLYLVKGLSLKDTSNLSGVSYDTVNRIILGQCHTWLQEVYPIEYHELIANHFKLTRDNYGTIVDPSSNTYTVTNIRQFARDHNLDASALSRVLNRKAVKHKGWKLHV